MIDAAALERVQSWVGEAEAAGARALLRGRRRGSVLRPTVLTDVTPRMKVEREEVFGPVTTLTPYRDFASALARVNSSAYGLQAGIFTADLRRALQAFATLEVGGVIVNDFPTLRLDHYPYGGVKDSGFGREGVRYAMEEMSEPRMLVLR
jgi:glyceraldehyde-3-phosphate dehydrogenase (NADP+)